jgi:hypothetical protein
VEVEARQTASVDEPFSSGVPLPGVRLIAGLRGSRLFITFDAPGPVPVVQLELRDQPDPDTAPTVEHLAIEVGETPGSFDEGGA